MSEGIVTAEDARRYECQCGGALFEVVEHEGEWLLCCHRCSGYHPKAQIIWREETDTAPRTAS